MSTTNYAYGGGSDSEKDDILAEIRDLLKRYRNEELDADEVITELDKLHESYAGDSVLNPVTDDL